MLVTEGYAYKKIFFFFFARTTKIKILKHEHIWSAYETNTNIILYIHTLFFKVQIQM